MEKDRGKKNIKEEGGKKKEKREREKKLITDMVTGSVLMRCCFSLVGITIPGKMFGI